MWDDIPTEIALLEESETMLTEIDSVTRQYDELCARVPLGSEVLDAVTSRKLEQFESRLVDLIQQRRDHAMCYQDLPFPDKVPPTQSTIKAELMTRAEVIARLASQDDSGTPAARATGQAAASGGASGGGKPKTLKSNKNVYSSKPNYKKR